MAIKERVNFPLEKLVQVEAIAFTERDGRKYVAVKGEDARNHSGYVIFDFDKGDLIYEHAYWMVGAYASEGSIHHEYERKLEELQKKSGELYFGNEGVATQLRRDLQDQISSREKVLASA